MQMQQNKQTTGQLVWSPADPSLGVGVVTHIEGRRVRVRFLRLAEERIYAASGREQVLMRYKMNSGEKVRDKDGNEVLIKTANELNESGLLTYELDDGRVCAENELIPDIRAVGAKERLASLDLVHPEILRARTQGLRLAKFAQRPGHSAILGARAQWLPHQLDVATRAVANDPVRLLLADEVGLGKTVEAALIFAGLRAERRANRVLILAPNSLCIQWLGEIYRKVHDLPVLLDEDRLSDIEREYSEINPFEAHQHLVVSIDSLKSDVYLAQNALLADWDLVIVDEAHHLRWNEAEGGNRGYQIVEGLAEKTKHLLLLTATPMALDPAEYHALLRLLDSERFDAPEVFAEATERAGLVREVGKALALAVENKEEFDKDVLKQAKQIFADDVDDQEAFKRFAKLKTGDKKRAAILPDIIGALRERHGLADFVVRNRRGPVGGLPERRPQLFPLAPSEQQENLMDIGEGVILDLLRTFTSMENKNQLLGESFRALWATPRALMDVVRPISRELANEIEPYVDAVIHGPVDEKGLPTVDMRLRWLLEQIRALGEDEKLLVFVERPVAVQALKDSLDNLYAEDVAVFHRALAPRDQDRQVAWFREAGGPKVMLSTEAGGEGRNFQFCHNIVLYDMPWRPATVEQRIGRVDRVGQRHDVNVLVPYFKSGYEAAILKIMQQSIGVLDRTVGGIDHALEYVSDELADLILEGGGSDAWKKLFIKTEKLVQDSRERIASGVDVILDHASFNQERVQEFLESIPEDIEAQTENFVSNFIEHSRFEVSEQSAELVSIEGAPSSSGRSDDESVVVGTYDRTYALDHEDVEFFAFGHPLVEQAFEWAQQESDASASLALLRGWKQDGAVFVWRFGLDAPDDAPELGTYFSGKDFTIALDESGKRQVVFEGILDDVERPLEKMDAAPLRGMIGRWRGLVDANYKAAQTLIDEDLTALCVEAGKKIEDVYEQRLRVMGRKQKRALARVSSADKENLMVAQKEEREMLLSYFDGLRGRLGDMTPRLQAVLALRLLKASEVSA
ncbi:MAG: SNF2-related protein [Myxococcota bacterium]|nr:SNF2-related protein [Myxococcota bacterium]